MVRKSIEWQLCRKTWMYQGILKDLKFRGILPTIREFQSSVEFYLTFVAYVFHVFLRYQIRLVQYGCTVVLTISELKSVSKAVPYFLTVRGHLVYYEETTCRPMAAEL